MANRWRLVYGGTELEIDADTAMSIKESLDEMAMEEGQPANTVDIRGEQGKRYVLLLSPSIPILLLQETGEDYDVTQSIY